MNSLNCSEHCLLTMINHKSNLISCGRQPQGLEPWKQNLQPGLVDHVDQFVNFLNEELYTTHFDEKEVRDINIKINQLQTYSTWIKSLFQGKNSCFDDVTVQRSVLRPYTAPSLRLLEQAHGSHTLFIKAMKSSFSAQTPEEKNDIEEEAAHSGPKLAYLGLKQLVSVNRGHEQRDVWLAAPVNEVDGSLGTGRVIIKRTKKFDTRQKREFVAQALLSTVLADELNICPLLEFYETEDSYIGVSEAGECDLLDFLKSVEYQNLTIKDRLNLFHGCLNAIDAMHRLGLAHRDISLENFVIRRDEAGKPFVQVIDLGHVGFTMEIFERLTGKVPYLAPEMYFMRPEGKYDASKTDSFALGVTLYCLLFLEMPFGKAQNSAQVRLSEIVVQKVREEKVGMQVEFLLCGLLNPDPNKRFAVCDAKAILENILI